MGDAMTYFYNAENGTVLGRTGKSWAKILFFYLIYYTLLALIFFYTLKVYEGTLDKKEGPRLNSRLDQPGISIVPHQSQVDDNINNEFNLDTWSKSKADLYKKYEDDYKISCRSGNFVYKSNSYQSDYEYYMVKFLATTYGDQSEEDLGKMGLGTFFDCQATVEKDTEAKKKVNGDKGCKVRIEVLRQAAKEDQPYFFVALNKVIGWPLMPFSAAEINAENEDIKGVNPTQLLTDWIRTGSGKTLAELDAKLAIGGKTSAGKVWFNCYLDDMQSKDKAQASDKNNWDVTPIKPYLDFFKYEKKDAEDLMADYEASTSRSALHKQVAVFQLKKGSNLTDFGDNPLNVKGTASKETEKKIKDFFKSNQFKCEALAKNLQYFVKGDEILTTDNFKDGQGYHVFGFIKETLDKSDPNDVEEAGQGQSQSQTPDKSTKAASKVTPEPEAQPEGAGTEDDSGADDSGDQAASENPDGGEDSQNPVGEKDESDTSGEQQTSEEGNDPE